MPRRFPIFQFPNPPLIVAGLAAAAARITHRRYSGALLLVSNLALLVWALGEVADGANWFRRLLGLGGGGYALSGLLQSAGSRCGMASAKPYGNSGANVEEVEGGVEQPLDERVHG